MSLTSHLEELRRKHQSLSQEVEMAQRAPATSDFEIAQMKKRKLMLKEEIARLTPH